MTSIIICTHNRGGKLQAFLKSLGEMDKGENLSYEIVIVDNNSTDRTKEIINGFTERTLLNITYVFEANQGLSYARNKGVQEARGDILAFTDDDCIPNKDWLINISKKFQADPLLAGIGGRVELYDKRDRAITIRTSQEISEFKSVDQLYSLIAGCNMAFRRTVFDEIGVFDPVFGAGTKLASSEDSDFLYRAYKKGFKIKYYPDILVLHNHGRRTDMQVRTLGRGYACGRGAFYCKHILLGDTVIMKLAFGETMRLMMRLIKNLVGRKSIRRQRTVAWGLILGVIRGFPIFLRRLLAPRSRPTVDGRW